MKKIILGVIVIGALNGLLFYAKLSPENNAIRSGAHLQWRNCWFLPPVFRSVHCANFYPTKDKTVRLAVVVIRDGLTSRDKNPVVYVADGPGYAGGITREKVYNWIKWMETSDIGRDVVIYDPRGTGLSRPQIQCPDLAEGVEKILTRPFSAEEQQARLFSLQIGCVNTLEDKKIKIPSYSTKRNVQDLNSLLSVLEVEKATVIGTGYGAIVAMQAARTRNNRIGQLVLDAPYEQGINIELYRQTLYHRSLQRLYTNCRLDSYCRKYYAKTEQKMQELLGELQVNPVALKVRNNLLRENFELVINDYRLLSIVHHALTNEELITKLPSAIDAFADRDYESFTPFAQAYVNTLINVDYSNVTYHFIACNEPPKFTDAQYRQQLNQVAYSEYFENFWKYRSCHMWKNNHVERMEDTAMIEQPALVFAGGYDPIVSSRWSKTILTELQNSFYIEFPHAGHGVAFGKCAKHLVAAFVADPSNMPEHDCLETLDKPEFDDV